METDTEVIQGAVSVAVAALSALLGSVYGRRRERAATAQHEATATQTLVDTALHLLEPYERRLEQLEALDVERRRHIDRLTARIVTLESHVAAQDGAIVALGGQPPPRP